MVLGFERCLECVFVGGEGGDEMFESDNFFGFFVEEVHGGVEMMMMMMMGSIIPIGLE